MLAVTVVAVPDCPNMPVLRARLDEVMAGHPNLRLIERTVWEEADAVRFGMRGSPTVLVNGIDPFAEADMPVSVSCRIYRDEAGRVTGAPTVEMLRRALEGDGREFA
jgi:hypothetical protein